MWGFLFGYAIGSSEQGRKGFSLSATIGLGIVVIFVWYFTKITLSGFGYVPPWLLWIGGLLQAFGLIGIFLYSKKDKIGAIKLLKLCGLVFCLAVYGVFGAGFLFGNMMIPEPDSTGHAMQVAQEMLRGLPGAGWVISTITTVLCGRYPQDFVANLETNHDQSNP